MNQQEESTALASQQSSAVVATTPRGEVSITNPAIPEWKRIWFSAISYYTDRNTRKSATAEDLARSMKNGGFCEKDCERESLQRKVVEEVNKMMAASEERGRERERLAAEEEEENDHSSAGDETFGASSSSSSSTPFFPPTKRTPRRFRQIESAIIILRHARITNPSYTVAEAMKATGIAERWCGNTVLRQEVISRMHGIAAEEEMRDFRDARRKPPPAVIEIEIATTPASSFSALTTLADADADADADAREPLGTETDANGNGIASHSKNCRIRDNNKNNKKRKASRYPMLPASQPSRRFRKYCPSDGIEVHSCTTSCDQEER